MIRKEQKAETEEKYTWLDNSDERKYIRLGDSKKIHKFRQHVFK